MQNQSAADDAYEVGLSKVREAVISSHFMHRLSENSDLRLYRQDHFDTLRLDIDETALESRLLPILKTACATYCQRRVDAARRRAREQFRDYGCDSAQDVGASEFITEAIFDKEFSRNGTRYNEKKRLNQQLKSLIRAQQPIEMVIPALPFKIPSPLKSRGAQPDLGEVNFLLSLYEITRVVESLYEPEASGRSHGLATFTIVSDGLRFNEAVNKPNDDIERYQSALMDWVRRLGLEAYIRIVDYKSLLRDHLSEEDQNEKNRLFQAAHADYSRTLWPIFDPYNVVDSLEAAARVELDPELENPQGRFVSLLKSLIFTVNYRTLQNLDGVSEPVRAELYRELTTRIFQPYARIGRTDFSVAASEPHHCASRADLSPDFMERLRQSMLYEVWEAAICYISEIKSDRDREQDPILACLPAGLRWTIHRKRGQIAIATPPILGMAVQAWAGSAVFRPAGKDKIRLCSLPALLLESSGAIPVAMKSYADSSGQPLFYVDSQLGVSDIDDLLTALDSAFTRQRFS
ncbi:MAG: L-tyrosine/L-tryptophan isonitrile synthase family protein [Xanthomonadales bacterium]|nr:L-tyrosine/L-tryptophan isonitrile synthase family protein [Xanthomonadales bacterium]